MIILSNGYQLPETGDQGSVWFPALESNIQRLNDHTHDGSNSNKIPSSSIEAVIVSVLIADFSASGNGFIANVTIPSAAEVDKTSIIVRDPTTKNQVHLDVVKTGVSTFTIYTNFVQDFEVLLV